MSSLGDTCEMYQPQTISKSETTPDGAYPVFGANGIIGRYHQFNHEESQLLMTCRGATCGTINVSEPKSWITGNSMVIRPRSSEIDRRFLEQYLRSGAGISDAITGSAQPQITRASLEPVPLPLAPLPEQRRIVAKVDGLTARTARARKELNRIPTLIARYKQRLLALAFSGGKIVARTTLDDITERVTKGESPGWQGFEYQEGGILFLRSQNVGWGKLLLNDQVFLDPTFNLKREKSMIQFGDVMLNIVGASIGRTAVATEEVAGSNCNQAVAIIRLRDRDVTDQKYVCWWLQSPEAQNLIVEGAVDVARANFSLANIRAMNLPWPNKSVRTEIVRRIESAFGWLDRMAADHAAASKLVPRLDAAILAKAFRGELVPQDPNDEPAGVLLERINAEREAAPKKIRGRKSKLPAIIATALGTFEISGYATATVADQPKKSGAKSMTKSRQDDDVKDKPYLADLLKSAPNGDVQTLFRAADLPVADFYKQLAWEIGAKHIIDDAKELKAA